MNFSPCLESDRISHSKAALRSPRRGNSSNDLWCLITRGVAERAAEDRPLFDRVASHREIFFRWSWVDYSTLHPGALRFVPLAQHLDDCRKDYQEMRGHMFFGEVPTFDEIIRVVGDFENRFNKSSPT